MPELEKSVESYLTKQVNKLGGLCWKWVSPGNSGVPDRIVIYKGSVVFVELKRPKGGKLRALQMVKLQQLTNQRQEVRVINTKAQVDQLIGLLQSIPDYDKGVLH